ncbi:hypothetical protein R6Q57_013624 [Mikania cordata]
MFSQNNEDHQCTGFFISKRVQITVRALLLHDGRNGYKIIVFKEEVTFFTSICETNFFQALDELLLFWSRGFYFKSVYKIITQKVFSIMNYSSATNLDKVLKIKENGFK